METKPEKPEADKSLMDKIAADPAIINRSATDAGEPEVVVTPPDVAADVVEPEGESSGAVKMDGQGGFGAPVLNLLNKREVELAPAVAPTAAGPAPRHKLWLVVAGGVAFLVLAGGGGYYLYAARPVVKVAVATPTPRPTQTPSPTATPTPTPTPTPAPIPAAANVTAPAALPTSDHPQAVTVKSPSGLWLRSSANSSNKSNIIGWIPNHGTVTVDAVGAFWWHGTYGGKTGYFASNYTQ